MKKVLMFGGVISLMIVLSGCVDVKTPGANVSVDSNGVNVKTSVTETTVDQDGVVVNNIKVNTKNVDKVDSSVQIEKEQPISNQSMNKKEPLEERSIECKIIGDNLYASDKYANCKLFLNNAYYNFGYKNDKCSVLSGDVYSKGKLSCKYNKNVKILEGSDNISRCRVDIASKKVVYDSPILSCELDLSTGTVNRTIK